MMPWRILLGDDHGVVLEGLRRILDRPGFEIVGAVKDGRALVEAAVNLHPDMIIADLSMPLLNGVDAARQIRRRGLKTKIIFLTMHPEPIFAAEAMRTGGSGYLLKDTAGEELLIAIQEVLNGRVYVTSTLAEPVRRALHARRKDSSSASGRLTPRQREVLQLMAEGCTPKEIATLLKVSTRTVEFHKYRIMDILGLRSVAELAAYAVKSRLVI
jgi:DNA-binding NarL/FixJ family response regulator